MGHMGVLAYGSLLTSPGWELDEATESRIEDLLTPFQVEFARTSGGRGGAPTLVPVVAGGSQVKATVLVMKEGISLSDARNMTYRRERDKVGHLDLVYTHREAPGRNQVHLPTLNGFAGVDQVIYTVLGDTIPKSERTGADLATFAIRSVMVAEPGQDGISYLRDAICMGIETPLTYEYLDEVLRRTGKTNLDDAIDVAKSS